MLEEKFREYLKATKKSPRTIDRYAICAKNFEEYLKLEKNNLNSEEVTIDCTHGKISTESC